MKKIQQGFTLIELLIVIAIIGILAAIAIPQYSDYVTRAKYQDGVTSLESTKTTTAECIQNNNGDATQCNTDAKIDPSTSFTMPTSAGSGHITIARGTFTAGTAIFTVTGDATLGTCTVTETGTVATNNVTWAFATTGTNCTKRKTGY